jgi:hypothetical protein
MVHEEIVELSRLEASPPEIRRFPINKWHLATLVLVIIVITQIFLYLKLNSDYIYQRSELQLEYNSLHSSCGLLQVSYDMLQSNYYSFLSGYADLRNQINKRALQFGVKDFITPKDTAVENVVLNITGGWSTTSDWSEFWNNVKKMYDWVVNSIKFRPDGLFPTLPSTPLGNIEYKRDMWQFPNETLSLREGDCEDMAMLLTSIMLSYGGEKYGKIECIMIRGSLGAHVGLQMLFTGDKLTILDPAGHFYTQTLDGNLDSKDISTEINNWLNHWEPEVGSDARVERVFSSSVDKEFSSISEYVSWMYTR